MSKEKEYDDLCKREKMLQASVVAAQNALDGKMIGVIDATPEDIQEVDDLRIALETCKQERIMWLKNARIEN